MTRGGMQRELGGALVALRILLLIVLAAAIWISHDLESRARKAYANEAIPTKSAAQDLVLELVNEATGSRAFITSGRPGDLDPYRMGAREVRRDLAVLDRSTAAHPELREPLERARRQVMVLDGFYAEQIALARTGPAGRRRALANLDEGRSRFGAFRDAASALSARTDAFVGATVKDQRDRYRTLLIVLGVVGAAALGIALALIFTVPRRTARRLAEERRARETLDRVLSLTPRFLDGASP